MINMSPRIKDIERVEPNIYIKALQAQARLGNTANSELRLNTEGRFGGFNWQDSVEGYAFWKNANNRLKGTITIDNYTII